ncbi:protein TRI1 [Ricinus communis]|uniref:Brg-1 associated factor, putative n=1 Tax=Ricinus communis TaxID=3988 RepID=B9SDA4_RICCO|nr:protein TRI1 [Ricinus communis]EEF38341.1 brg-1 associated factor, putative [Ricinus communis]|eukprot:XP_002523973.1 protein TRI1 [Ricinus communis]
MSRVFRGYRALLAPTKSAAAAAAAAAAPSKSTATKKSAAAAVKPKDKPVRATGILKAAPVSPALSEFLGGVPEASRTDVVKKIWDHIKLHNLQNPTNKKEIFCDEKLKTIFDGKEKVGFLEIGKLLSRHFVKSG